MKIGVDIRVLMDEYYSGVAEYTANLLSAILKQDTDNEYRLFYNSWRNLDYKLQSWQRSNAQIIARHFPNKIFNYFLQKILHWPKLDQVLGGIDIFWSPHFNFSSFSSVADGLKKVITVHDLSFLRYPEFFNYRQNFWHWALKVKKIILSADLIIAVSESTKDDLQELLGVAEEKIKVIYPGNNIVKREVSTEEKQEFLKRKHLSQSFILYLGNIEPRKNIDGLIMAFNDLRIQDAQGEKIFSKLQLVLAGARAWKNKKIYRLWKESPYQSDIIFLGYVSKKSQEILYSSAQVLAYPSYYEGFGFPPLEALTYGLPVVCSNNSSLPEVVGEAAITINPLKTSEITNALQLILTDQDLREQLITKGYQRSKKFSWGQSAQEYLTVFQELYEEGKRNKKS